MMFVNEADAQSITRYMDITAVSSEADLLWVFGNSLLQPAHIAAEIILANRVPYVVLTGGIHQRLGFNEAEAHLRTLLGQGVSRERIIVENGSSNTRENVIFALPRIAEYLEVDNIRSVMVIAMWHHCRRATMTLKRYLPPGIRYSNSTYEYGGATREGWWNNEQGRVAVMSNWRNIQEYLKRDHIAEIQKEDGLYI